MSEKESLPYKVLKPISYKGDRIEKGSVVHMTSEEAENIGDEFLEPAESADQSEVPAETSDSKTPEDENPKDDPDEETETTGDKNPEGGEEDPNDTNTNENL